MTNYIEEMMRTAGVEEEQMACSRMAMNLPQCDKKECKSCKYSEYELPDFTPEKQLEIIKLIALENFIDIRVPVSTGKWAMRYSHSNREPAGRHQDFSQALAQLTTELMKAGELDKEKVKEILEK